MVRPEPTNDTSTSGTSVYVHVPFCVVKCGYCDFTSYVVEDESIHDAFLAALAKELELTTLPVRPQTVFIGGGTPTHLSTPRFEALLALLDRHLDLRGCREVTMEANPESVTREKAAIALAAGVNRFSMGVQSFDPARLRFLDRAHSGDRARAAFAELRSAGVVNASIDMIFGLPGESVADWEADLVAALALQPDHLSCYNLTFEPGTRLHRDLRQGKLSANDEEVDRELFLRTRELLAARGFDAYEISNFAGRGGPCRHNDHYWLQGDYVGVGPGASSHRAGHRSTNLKAMDAWLRSALDGIPPTATAEVLTPEQRVGEAMWLGLRRTAGIDLDAIAARLGVPVQRQVAGVLERQLGRGWIEVEGSRVRLTAAGLIYADAVGSDYLVVDS